MRLVLCLLACLGLAACGDPIADFPRLADQDIPDGAPSVDAVATTAPEAESLMERLGAEGETEEPTQMQDTAPAPEKPAGLFALFTRKDAAPVPTASADSRAEAEDKTVLASLPAASDANVDVAEPAVQSRRGGLFGLANSRPAAVTSEIAPGTVLPYGKVARICDLPKTALGKKIAQYPERGPKHVIYDSAPGTIEPHSFFLTGFADGCARQFTASLAMFGTIEMHEQLRYGLPAEVQPYSDTDKAYEAVKSRVCGVPSQKPCGARISRLDGSTVFVSIYERFGSNPTWSNLLLHNGEIVAQDQKGG